MGLAEKISNAELEIMKILWRESEPVPFSVLRAELGETVGWEKSTVNTLIRRLADKGVIETHRGDVLRYTPNITRAEYSRAEGQSLIDRLYGGSAKNFVAALCRGGKLSEKDIDDLKDFFKVEGEK